MKLAINMAGVMNFLSAPFFHKPAKPEPLATQWVVNIVYKLNTMTGSFLFLSSCILFFREIVSDHIHCFNDANRGGGIVSTKDKCPPDIIKSSQDPRPI